MKKRSQRIAILTLLLCVVFMPVFPAYAATHDGHIVKVFPQEIDDVLLNPDMGWVLIDNAIPNHIDVGRSGTYPQVSNVTVLSNWGELEPQEGVYDWSLVDQAIQYWSGLGKRIHFRISTDAMLISGYGYAKGVPDWLLESPYNVPYQERYDQNYTFKLADYTNVIYKEKLENFMQAFADKYRNNEHLDIVDLRAYGTWGEWHSGHDFSSYTKREETLKELIDVWYEAWNEDKILAISNSYEWRSEMQPSVHNPASYEQYMKWSAFDHALEKPLLTFRRDGAGGALGSYDTRLLDEFFASNKRLPLIAEFFSVYADYAKSGGSAGYNPDTALDEALTLHPNYITIMGHDGDTSAPEFYSERPDLVAKGNKLMGYRFVLKEAQYPSVVKQGDVLDLYQIWSNEAVGRSYNRYPLKVILTDQAGNEVWSAIDETFDQTTYVRGERYDHQTVVQLPASLAPGSYELKIAMVNEATGTPAILLGIEGADNEKRYKIGDIKVVAATDTVSLAELEEDFEKGAFEGTVFGAGFNDSYGQIVSDPAKVVSGSYSAYGATPHTTDWYEFLNSKKERLVLEGGATYRVTFQYKTLADPGAGGFYYFFARSSAGGTDQGVTQWLEPLSSSVKSKSVLLTLDHYDDYELIWGLHQGGAISIDNIVIERLSESYVETFEDGDWTQSLYAPGVNHIGTLTTDLDKKVSGQYSAYGSAPSTADWTEFLHSDGSKLHLTGGGTYAVTFKYKLHAQPQNGGFLYMLARTPSGGMSSDKGFTRWLDVNGAVATKTVLFTLDDYEDYYLIWGLHKGGAASIDEISIKRLPNAVHEDFEAGSFAQSLYTAGIGGNSSTITGIAPLSGNYSVHAMSPASKDWLEYLHSDAAKLALEPNTVYTVTFQTKSTNKPGNGGYYYFLARSASGTSDRGFTQWHPAEKPVDERKTFTFKTGSASDYYLIWGIHNGGSLVMDEVTLIKHGG